MIIKISKVREWRPFLPQEKQSETFFHDLDDSICYCCSLLKVLFLLIQHDFICYHQIFSAYFKYRKIPLICLGRIYRQRTNLMGLYSWVEVGAYIRDVNWVTYLGLENCYFAY